MIDVSNSGSLLLKDQINGFNWPSSDYLIVPVLSKESKGNGELEKSSFVAA